VGLSNLRGPLQFHGRANRIASGLHRLSADASERLLPEPRGPELPRVGEKASYQHQEPAVKGLVYNLHR
jgi:hypothetical protein